MSGAEHHRRLLHITQSAAVAQHTGGRQGAVERWCDVCQSSFTGDIILHRRCKEHKESKKSSRPFCSVCRRHFRTPRKFVEHMKSREHKQQVKLEEAQDEEMITVDAVGCFESESKTRERRQRRNAPGLKGDEGGDPQGLKGDEGGDAQGLNGDEGGEAQGLKETGQGDDEGGDTPGQTGVEGGDARGGMGEDAQGKNRDKGGDKDVRQKETGRGHVEERTERNVAWPEAEEEDGKEGKLGRIGDKETETGDSEDGGDAEELMEEVQTEEFSPHTAHGDSYVVPVSGFFCRLCHRFFFRERTRDEHCGSQEHLSRVLQSETQSRVSPSSEDSA
uniref:C2H2-type domain-containing protein n=1 Tax=Neogobius melanostomus TaxID=47308 RepID=A0A8C6SIW3_9GOBI